MDVIAGATAGVVIGALIITAIILVIGIVWAKSRPHVKDVEDVLQHEDTVTETSHNNG